MRIKNCPFCGCDSIPLGRLGKDDQLYRVCINCDAKGPMRHTKKNATKAWNRRSSTIDKILHKAKEREERKAKEGKV